MTVIKYLSNKDEHLVSEILITLVRDIPMFYDKKCKDYKNKHKKDKKWRELKTAVFESTGITIKKGKIHPSWYSVDHVI